MRCSCKTHEKKCDSKKRFSHLISVLAATGILVAIVVLSGCVQSSGKMAANSATDPVVNTKCPIKGNSIVPSRVPAAKIRHFEGKKVGFCCGGCPAAWDRLSHDEKAAKLKQAM